MRPRRLLALDVDGTLLDGEGRLTEATARAVNRAAASGIRPILCTGRRYRRARPIAEALGLDGPIVCNSGALVKEVREHRTLWRADLDEETASAVLRLFRASGHSAVSFTDHAVSGPDFLVDSRDFPTGSEHLDEYVTLNREHAQIQHGWSRGTPGRGLFHLCAIHDRPAMLLLERRVIAGLGPAVRTFVQKSPRYRGTMCEVLRGDASKWTALLRVASLLDVDSRRIIAVGDDLNDLPMLEGASLSVAMGHAPTAVLEAADVILGDQDSGDLAAWIERLVDDDPPDRAA